MRPRLVGCSLLLILGCTAEPRDLEGRPEIDLTAGLAGAEVLLEVPLLDIGTPPARHHLGHGWSWNQGGAGGPTFAWGTGDGSQVSFFLARVRPLSLAFRCRPAERSDAPVERLEIVLNDRPLPEVSLQPGWRSYRIELPPSHLRRGVNRMQVIYHRSLALPEPTSRRAGRRRTAVAWDWLRFAPMEPPFEPVSPTPRVLDLGPGSRLDLYLEAPAGSFLATDGVSSLTADDAEVEIAIQRDGGAGIATHRAPAGGGSTAARPAGPWSLADSAGPVRIRLQATAPARLHRPRIVTSAAADSDATAAAPPPAAPIDRRQPPLVLLYLVDTLRADHLRPYGYTSDTSPRLAKLAADGVVFDDAQAHSSWTKPTTASILTGQLPWSHGAEKKNEALSGQLPTLAHHLRQAGFATGGFSANGNISSAFGFHHGFDHFALMGRFDASAAEVHRAALAWLDQVQSASRRLLYVHTIDPHAPYLETERFRSDTVTDSDSDPVGTVPFMRHLSRQREEPGQELIDNLVELYDLEIHRSDRELGHLVEELRRRNLYDEALIVVLSDHGEEFYDHRNWTHGRTLYREVLTIPLLIKFPGRWAAGTRVTATVQQIDLLPTLLDYLELEPATALPGSSLLPAVAQALSAGPTTASPALASRPAFARVHYHHNQWVSVIRGDWKLIVRSSQRLDRQPQLFHRPSDPLEQRNLAGDRPVLAGYLASMIRAEMAPSPLAGASRPVEIDDETRRRLQALGYLD